MSRQRSISARNIRKLVIEQAKRAFVGHIGPALAVADMVAVLFEEELRMVGSDEPSRDRFILSKGHGAVAVYSALYLKGLISRKQLQSYCSDGSFCGALPGHHLAGIDFSTGSLGHGLALGAGVALAAKLSNEDFRAFVLVGEEECYEGSIWETVQFAVRHNLSNLVAIVEDSHPKSFGRPNTESDRHSPADEWRVFGWEVHEVDGHDRGELRNAFKQIDTQSGSPKSIISRTVCGKGVGFMEGKSEWHYLKLNDEQYAVAMKQLEEAEEQ